MEILEIITRVLSGDASYEDKISLQKWLQEDQENMRLFKQTESLWFALEIMHNKSNYNADKAFSEFENRISTGKNSLTRFKSKRLLFLILNFAAALIVVLLLLKYFDPKNIDSFAIGTDNTYELVTPRGSRAQLVLSDGTKIWLNADSKLSYSDNYNKESREVSLEGEGYFEVATNSEKPFTVNASGLIIKASGTSFNVESYVNNNSIKTTLINGIVDLELKTSDVDGKILSTLKPNQEAIFYKDFNSADRLNPNMKQIEINDIDSAIMSVSWRDNIMIFKNETFQDLAVKLERRFGVTIRFLDEDIKGIQFSGKFEDVFIEELLEALKFASPFYYSFDNNLIYISDKQIKQN